LEEERVDIARIHLAKRRRDPKKFKVADIAAKARDFSGSEIEEAIISAMYDAFHDGEREFTTKDVLAAITATKPLSTTAAEDLNRIKKWAEGRTRPATLQASTARNKGARKVSA